MKALRIVVGIIVVLVAIFFIGGIFLPKTYSISRSIVINAPDSTVFMNVADFNNFLKWNPWTKMEPSAKVTITGTPAQNGHKWEWVGKETGHGTMEIKEVKPYSWVGYDLKFIEPFESVANCNFTFERVGNAVKVTWGMSGNSKTTSERWMGLGMDSMMDKDFTSGLENLKQLSEK